MADPKCALFVPQFEPQFEMTPRRDPRAAPRVPVALAPCATTIRVGRARPQPRAWPECRERVRRPAPRHPLWGRSAPPQRVGPHPSNKTIQLLMSRQSERQRRPPRGWRRGSRSGPRVRAAANAPARNRMRRGGPAFALLRTVVSCIYMCGFSRLPSPLRCGCRRVRRRMARSPSSCLCGRRHLPGPCAQRICHGQRARRRAVFVPSLERGRHGAAKSWLAATEKSSSATVKARKCENCKLKYCLTSSLGILSYAEGSKTTDCQDTVLILG